MTSIGKEKKAVNAYLIKNSKGEGVGGMVGGGGGGRKAFGRTGQSCRSQM